MEETQRCSRYTVQSEFLNPMLLKHDHFSEFKFLEMNGLFGKDVLFCFVILCFFLFWYYYLMLIRNID